LIRLWRYGLASVVAIVTAVLRFPGFIGAFMSVCVLCTFPLARAVYERMAQLSTNEGLHVLFDAMPLDAGSWANHFRNVVAYCTLMPVMMLLTMMAAVPAGVVMPIAGMSTLRSDVLQTIPHTWQHSGLGLAVFWATR
jgi:hypothetical protein